MNDQDMIAAIASKRLGPAPQGAPQAAPGGAPPQQMAPPPPPKADPSPTNIEKAQAKVAPSDPGAESPDVPLNFLKVGDREYTEDQVKGTMSRYKDLNYKWQTNKPTMDVLAQLMDTAKKSGYDAKPEEMAQLVDAAVKAYIKNPQMGGQQRQEGTSGKQSTAQQPMGTQNGNGDTQGDSEFGDPDAVFSQWEKENAVKLPPGFRENLTSSKAMSGKVDQMMAMFQKMMEGGFGGQMEKNQATQAADQAKQMVGQAQTLQSDASLKMVSNNLNNAFNKAGIDVTTEVRGDFRMFSAQRGYDFSDFMDQDLTAMLVADYKANKDAPEVTRLREMAKKRQAFTGMAESSPGAGAPAAPVGDPMLANMVSTAMGKRNM
jgi:hypothetical protein